MNCKSKGLGTMLNLRHDRNWPAWGIILISFAAGWLLSAMLLRPTREVRADANRVFELMIYHAKPGKAEELEAIFRDVSKLQAKHNLSTLGYWVPNDDPAWKDTFVYLVAHPSKEDAKKNWNELHRDPAFLPYRKQAAPLIQQVGGQQVNGQPINGAYRVDEVFMRPTEYSAIR